MLLARIFSKKNIVFKKDLHNSFKTTACFCSQSQNSNNENDKTGGYAKSYEKFKNINDIPARTSRNFASLLRNSKFIDLGDPEKKVVTGKIYHVIEDDLYIDFGWKFHCVCPRPKKNPSAYVRGANVRLLIKDLELSSKFLGFDKDLTLLEADCVLLGLAKSRGETDNAK